MPRKRESPLISFAEAAASMGVDRRVVGCIVKGRQIPHEDLGTIKLLSPQAVEEIRSVLSPPECRVATTR